MVIVNVNNSAQYAILPELKIAIEYFSGHESLNHIKICP
jgi:hypothetical protein